MKIAKNNMGAITKKEIERFASGVIKELKLEGWKMKWTTAGDICIRDSKIIYIDKSAIHKYPWDAKQRVLHELAHIFTMNKFHGPAYFGKYVKLLKRFLVGDTK